jgi:hypothetical protein
MTGEPMKGRGHLAGEFVGLLTFCRLAPWDENKDKSVECASVSFHKRLLARLYWWTRRQEGWPRALVREPCLSFRRRRELALAAKPGIPI